ncbi:MAG TPA: SpoIIE family protein phosphatase [Vicinamibacterales bacterium]|nr:SpoIIE family protein phosphatase [Vicinamibacterales bacterium]
MAAPVRPPLLPGPALSRADVWKQWLLGTFPGRSLLIGLIVKSLTAMISAVAGGLPPVIDAIDMVGSLALIFAAAYGLTRFVFWAKRGLLWRVRRKLILSYVFVGVVPVLLVITFFLLAGLLLFFNVSSYLVKARLRSLNDQVQFLAQTTVAELQPSPTSAAFTEVLERRLAGIETRYPFVSLAIVPVGGLSCPVEPARAARAPRTAPISLPRTAGAWAHLDPPIVLPKWITCQGFSGLLAYNVLPTAQDAQAHTRLVIRAVAFPELPNPTWAVVLDVPLSSLVEQRITDETGIRIGEVTALPFGSRENVLPVAGRAIEPIAADPLGREQTFSLTTQRWVAFLDYTDWATGTQSGATLAMRINAWAIYDRLSAASASVGEMNFGQLLLAVLALVGGLFLIIQFVALVIGLLLARQITGAVHDLFTGTQHLRNRDFVHTIPVRARDQLGELADSFNVMTGEVQKLLGEVVEKGRMEQEMHAAREIQQKLLPPAPRNLVGLTLAAFCEPAREVAGDYYDFLPITDTMIGVLIADVAGKGLAAGLYMAQLKVIVQSLARLHHEPREFLIAVNRVVAQNLDAKSFITMTYGVIDLERHEMTFARAGHCPLIHVPGRDPAGLRHADVLAPDGLVVGLNIDDGQLFESMLQERTVSLAHDDLLVLFTDGISETMNEAFDCYGEARLSKVLEQYAHLPFDQLRSYILAELRAFAGSADQHDDMTMIMMRVG